MARPEHMTGSMLTGHFHRGVDYVCQRPSGTDDWLLFCTLSGRGRIAHRFGELLLGAGDMAILAPATPHDYRTAAQPGRWEFLWAHVHPRAHWLDWLRWPAPAPGVLHLRLPPGPLRRTVQQALADCHRQALAGGRRGPALAQAAFETALIHCDAANPLAGDAGRDPRVRAAMDYCARNLAGRFRLADVAAAAGLSVYRLAHLFRAGTGTTIQRFVESQRLQRAQELLIRTGMSVQEIADEVGFASAFYFSTRFRRATGSSPRAFRERESR
jgi:AraC family transcriptional regulator of arabinose operon